MSEFELHKFSGMQYRSSQIISFSQSPLTHLADVDEEMRHHTGEDYVQVSGLTQAVQRMEINTTYLTTYSQPSDKERTEAIMDMLNISAPVARDEIDLETFNEMILRGLDEEKNGEACWASDFFADLRREIRQKRDQCAVGGIPTYPL